MRIVQNQLKPRKYHVVNSINRFNIDTSVTVTYKRMADLCIADHLSLLINGLCDTTESRLWFQLFFRKISSRAKLNAYTRITYNLDTSECSCLCMFNSCNKKIDVLFGNVTLVHLF